MPPGPVGPEIYQKLCQLGEAATFVQGANDQLVQSVRALLEQIAGAGPSADSLGRQAGALMDAQPPAKGGILLAGTVQNAGSKGGLHAASVLPAGTDKPVSVMSNQPLPFVKDDKVVLLGGLIAEPAKNIQGYAGKKPVVIWLGMAVKAK